MVRLGRKIAGNELCLVVRLESVQRKLSLGPA
jgi:hypothetical protein